MPDKKYHYKMDTGKFVEIWMLVLDKGEMGDEFTVRIREAFDSKQSYDAKKKYPDNKDIWKKIKNKMMAIRDAAKKAGVTKTLPSIRYTHATGSSPRYDYKSMMDGLSSAAKPSSGDPYTTKVLAAKDKAAAKKS